MPSAQTFGDRRQDLAQQLATFFDNEREKLRAWRCHGISRDENELRSAEDRPSFPFPLQPKVHDTRVIDIEALESIAQELCHISVQTLHSSSQEQYGSSLQVESGEGNEMNSLVDVELQSQHEISYMTSAIPSVDYPVSDANHDTLTSFYYSSYPPSLLHGPQLGSSNELRKIDSTTSYGASSMASIVDISSATSTREIYARMNISLPNIVGEAPMLSLQEMYKRDKRERWQALRKKRVRSSKHISFDDDTSM
ncbi:hypothetical protein SCHPADRAFT_895384 [Schizopora paradoxa]|uniref:Uncharacterized protein n=1 Tax=Schizopora paradoxa TaxID=27342 RepID=A0A0H2R407_9AGAM|nr:hypothetical protein SCHPADRAFT_895384 [Schizopora paradoxa]